MGCCILNRLLAWPPRTSPEPVCGDRQGSPVQTTIKIWRISSEGDFSAMRTKVPFIFVSLSGIFCVLKHIGLTSDFFRICFIAAAIVCGQGFATGHSLTGGSPRFHVCLRAWVCPASDFSYLSVIHLQTPFHFPPHR